jgi:hypothetical protein
VISFHHRLKKLKRGKGNFDQRKIEKISKINFLQVFSSTIRFDPTLIERRSEELNQQREIERGRAQFG